MSRYEGVDIIKGIAVICMVVYHFFYFPNKYGFKEIEYDTPLLKTIARIAQFIFIGSVGINLSLSKDKSKKKNETDTDYIKKNIKRVLKIGFLAILMSIFTYFLFGDNFVKFGILHFIAVCSLLLFYFSDNIILIYILTVISIMLFYLIKKNPDIFSWVPEKIAFISGIYNYKYTSFDHFPIFPWIIIILFGIIIGNHMKNKNINLSSIIKDNIISKGLQKIGSKSLEIYSIHWIVLYFIYCIIYSKFIRKLPV